MKCPICDGTGKCYEQTIRYQEIETNRTELYLAKCKKCHGSGEVEMTNEEWMRTATFEELMEFLFKVRFDSKAPWQGTSIWEWLEEIHEEEKTEEKD